jgi:Kef-type K+ transport system membrane component KefB
MDPLYISLIIIFVAVTIIPTVAKKLRLPVIVAEIIFGIIIGRSLLNIVPDHQAIDFFSSFGLTFLMFLAGLEIDFNEVKRNIIRTIVITAFSIGLPFYVGFRLAAVIGFDYPFLLGTILSTTSLGLILPLARELQCKETLLHTLLGSVVLVDIISMFLLGFALTITPETKINTSLFYSAGLLLVLFFLPVLVAHKGIQDRINKWFSESSHAEIEVRLAFALIFVFGAVAEELEFHSIIGAFIAGLIISECTQTAPMLRSKLEGFGYGFFIPLLFIIIGAKVDLPSLFANLTNILVLVIIIGLAIGAKAAGVSAASLLCGFRARESLAMGLFHSARLSLIIAAVEIARKMELMDESLFSTFVILAVVSAIFGPSVGKGILHVQIPPSAVEEAMDTSEKAEDGLPRLY